MYAGKILEVDLTKGKSVATPLADDIKDQYLGGSALNLKLFADRCDPRVDPFSPENVIIIGVGALAGTLSPGSGKIAGTTKFPLPGTKDGKCHVGSGISGSRRFGKNLWAAGYDHLVIHGKSPTPVYLLIEDDRVEVCDAAHLWEVKDIYESTDELRSIYPGSGVMCIGKAGENLVKFALAITDRTSSMGTNGFGAVMGSKNLKAIVVRGSQKRKLHDPESFKAVVKKIREEAKHNAIARKYPELGAHAAWDVWRVHLNPGVWPVEEWDKLYGPEATLEGRTGTSACNGCFLACKIEFEVQKGERRGQKMTTGHFLDMSVLAQFLDIREWPHMAYLMDVCNRVGLCAMSGMGSAAVLAMARDAGFLDEQDAPGVDFSRKVEKYAELLRLIYERRGAGEAAAEGWLPLFEYLGGANLSGFLGIVKGAMCFFDMRDTKLDVMSFHMVVNPRGAHHSQGHWTMSLPQVPHETLRASFLQTGATEEDAERIFQDGEVKVGRLTRHIEDVGVVNDSIGACAIYNMIHLPLHMENLSLLYTAATGRQSSAAHLKRCGERGHNLLKLLNVKSGFGREHDQFPAHWFQPKVTADGEEIRLMDYYEKKELGEQDLLQELEEYYDERGWNPINSHPKPEKLEDLGLTGLA